MLKNDTQFKRRIRTLLVLLFQGMGHRRFIVERVTKSLRRMIYDTPKHSCRKGTKTLGTTSYPKTSPLLHS